MQEGRCPGSARPCACATGGRRIGTDHETIGDRAAATVREDARAMDARRMFLSFIAIVLRIAGLLFYGSTGFGLAIITIAVVDIVGQRAMPPRADIGGILFLSLLLVALPLMFGYICRGAAADLRRRAYPAANEAADPS